MYSLVDVGFLLNYKVVCLYLLSTMIKDQFARDSMKMRMHCTNFDKHYQYLVKEKLQPFTVIEENTLHTVP